MPRSFQKLTVKRGQAVSLSVEMTDANGVPRDVSAATVKAEVRDQDDTLIGTFTWVPTSPVIGQGNLTVPYTDVEGWALTTGSTYALMDLLVIEDGDPTYSRTIEVEIEKEITANA